MSNYLPPSAGRETGHTPPLPNFHNVGTIGDRKMSTQMPLFSANTLSSDRVWNPASDTPWLDTKSLGSAGSTLSNTPSAFFDKGESPSSATSNAESYSLRPHDNPLPNRMDSSRVTSYPSISLHPGTPAIAQEAFSDISAPIASDRLTRLEDMVEDLLKIVRTQDIEIRALKSSRTDVVPTSTSDALFEKDEAIRMLTQQVHALTTTVSNLSQPHTLRSKPSNLSNASLNLGGRSAPSPLPSPAVQTSGLYHNEQNRQHGLSISSQTIPQTSMSSLAEPSIVSSQISGSSNGSYLLSAKTLPRPLSLGTSVSGGQSSIVSTTLSRTSSAAGFGPIGQKRGSVGGYGGLRAGEQYGEQGLNANSWDGMNMNQGPPMLPPSPAHSSFSNIPRVPASTTSTNPPGSLGGKWETLGVTNEIFRNIAKYGIGPPTRNQTKAIPYIIRNQDIVSQAPSIQERIQTYVIPALQQIISNPSFIGSEGIPSQGIQVVIVTATVDQASQAQRLCVGLGGPLGIRTCLALAGGNPADVHNEASSLANAPPHVFVGTPQRLVDIFLTGMINCSELKLFVIDECDQIVARNMSDIVSQLSRMLGPSINIGSLRSFDRSTPHDAPQQRQTVVLSCTVPQDVLNFAHTLNLREPVRVLVRREGGDNTPSVRGLKSYYLYIPLGGISQNQGAMYTGRKDDASMKQWKLDALADLCEDYTFENCVIYCSSLDTVEAVAFTLSQRHMEAFTLHQDIGQSAKSNILANFRSNRGMGKKALVVYDALCRSLNDVSTPLVINYDPPRAVEDYIHRVSCALSPSYGRSGTVINIITPANGELEKLKTIESFYRCKITELPPSFNALS